MDKKQQFTMWYFLGSVVLLFAAQTYFARQHVGTISYSDFKALLQAGKVSDLIVGSETIEGTIDLTGAEALLPAEVYRTLREQQGGSPESTRLQGTTKSEGTPAQGPKVQAVPHRVSWCRWMVSTPRTA